MSYLDLLEEVRRVSERRPDAERAGQLSGAALFDVVQPRDLDSLEARQCIEVRARHVAAPDDADPHGAERALTERLADSRRNRLHIELRAGHVGEHLLGSHALTL
jgi:hypothetical protein